MMLMTLQVSIKMLDAKQLKLQLWKLDCVKMYVCYCCC